MTLPPRRLSLLSALGEAALTLVGGRLAFSMLHRGDTLPGILLLTLSAAAAVLAVRHLQQYRHTRATEPES